MNMNNETMTVDLNSLPRDHEGQVDLLSPVVHRPLNIAPGDNEAAQPLPLQPNVSELESAYSDLMDRLKKISGRPPVDAPKDQELAMECKRFAEQFGLIFKGFDIKSGKPDFHMPDAE